MIENNKNIKPEGFYLWALLALNPFSTVFKKAIRDVHASPNMVSVNNPMTRSETTNAYSETP